jgi:carboxylesterase
MFFILLASTQTLANADYKRCAFDNMDDCFGVEETANAPFVVTDQEVGEIRPTEYVFLMIHGLSDSPYYLKDMVANFAPYGMNMLGVRTTGHGTSVEDLNRVSYDDWIKDVEAGLRMAKLLGQKVILVGFSTGAPLAMYLYTQEPESISAMMFYAPAFSLSMKVKGFEVGWLAYNITCLTRYFGHETSHKEHGKIGRVRYQSIPAGGTCELKKLTSKLDDEIEQTKIDVPVFLLASINDSIADQISHAEMLDQNSSADSRESNVLVLEGDLSLLEEEDIERAKKYNLIETEEKVSHSGVMLGAQGFGGESEVNPRFGEASAYMHEFLQRNLEAFSLPSSPVVH